MVLVILHSYLLHISIVHTQCVVEMISRVDNVRKERVSSSQYTPIEHHCVIGRDFVRIAFSKLLYFSVKIIIIFNRSQAVLIGDD